MLYSLISDDKRYFGTIGATTKFKTRYGESLHVGDIVLKTLGNNYLKHDTISFVVEHQKNEPFIMGIKSSCDYKTGHTNEWIVLKIVKKYYEVDESDTYHGLKAKGLIETYNETIKRKEKSWS